MNAEQNIEQVNAPVEQSDTEMVAPSDVSAAEEESSDEEAPDQSYDALPVEEDDYAEIDSQAILDAKTRASNAQVKFGDQPEDDDPEDPNFVAEA